MLRSLSRIYVRSLGLDHVIRIYNMDTPIQPNQGFAKSGLSDQILTALNRCKFTVPTPIQDQAIPVALEGHDMIGIAQTGTGKTLAFGLPILDLLLNKKIQRALIIVPTRELALQVEQSIRNVTNFLPVPVRTVSLIGGMPIYRQISSLKQKPSIIVATPGRLRDHLDQKTVHLDNVGLVVLDEADRMLDMGFTPQINYIFKSLPAVKQTLLFSATFEPEIRNLAKSYLKDPEHIEIPVLVTDKPQIVQELCYVQATQKTTVLEKLLNEHAGTVLVFSRTKHGASKLAKTVQTLGHSAAEIHSNRSLSQRRHALDGFKRGTYRVLVATDVASRGIDVPDIALVVNYDLPDATEDYLHRIGRTGRASSFGKAISLATPDQFRDVKSIERFIKATIPLSDHSDEAPVQKSWSPAPSRSRYGNGGGQGGSSSAPRRPFSGGRNFSTDRSFSSSKPAFAGGSGNRSRSNFKKRV